MNYYVNHDYADVTASAYEDGEEDADGDEGGDEDADGAEGGEEEEEEDDDDDDEDGCEDADGDGGDKDAVCDEGGEDGYEDIVTILVNANISECGNESAYDDVDEDADVGVDSTEFLRQNLCADTTKIMLMTITTTMMIIILSQMIIRRQLLLLLWMIKFLTSVWRCSCPKHPFLISDDMGDKRCTGRTPEGLQQINRNKRGRGNGGDE